MNKGLLIVISGPSGVGKGTVLQEVFKRDSNLEYSVSCTTRPPRPGEIDGVHYSFITKKQFEDNIAHGRMLEYASYCGNYYGTSAEYVKKQRDLGHDVILEIETTGALQIKEKCPDAVMIFILPPNPEKLIERLSGRGTEKTETIEKRIAKAGEELAFTSHYEYLVVNDVVETAVDDICAILRAQRIKQNKNKIINEVKSYDVVSGSK